MSTPPDTTVPGDAAHGAPARRLRVAVYKFSSCDGCQLQFLAAIGRHPALLSKVEFVHFLEASRQVEPGPYDIGFVEGSVTTPHDVERIRAIRRQCRMLVTIGACATSGGIQALRNWGTIDDFVAAVYASPAFIETLATSTGIAEHVPVDFELRGCPIDTGQLVEIVTAAVVGRKPRVPATSVCAECKAEGTVCVAVTRGIPCLGPGRSRGSRRAPRRPSPARPRHQCLVTAVPGRRGPAGDIPSDRGFHPMSASRSFIVKALARVEGEGALRIRVGDDGVEIVEFNIYEPPRFFEKLLVGRSVEEVPDMVARICGICPVAYQMTACRALETALGIVPPDGVAALRRLLYCGEWIQSHALHVHLLHAPDFLGYESGFAMAVDHPQLVEAGFRLKGLGNRIMEVVGGRAVHPINVAVGGFHAWPAEAAVRDLVTDLEWGLGAALELVDTVSAFEFPPFDRPQDFVALRSPDEYPFNDGRIVSSDGLDIPAAAFAEHFEERQVAWSTALHAVRLPAGSPYSVGPIARLNLCRDRLPPLAARAAGRLEWPLLNPFRSIVARAIEIVAACEEALRIARAWTRPAGASRTPLPLCEGVGSHATEAPRGLLWHRYAVDARGLVSAAAIVPPTSQNQARIEADLRAFLPQVLPLDDAGATLRCEQLIRSYDPCISCATHFLRLSIERAEGGIIRP